MARGKSSKLKPFEKLLTIMVSGNPVTIEEIETTLGNEIYMYRLSTYMWHIKVHANGVVKSIKDGRKVSAYQIINVDEVKNYLNRTGVTKANFVPGKIDKKPSIAKLADLNAKPAPKAKSSPKVVSAPKVKAAPKVKVKVPSNVAIAVGADELTVTEITE
jgi:hypothetical protein